jgi:aspartate kinase
MKVLKFGGISLRDAIAIKKVSQIISSDSEKKFVVVSAFYGVTDLLSELVGSLKNSLPKNALECIDKFENISQNIVSELNCKNSSLFVKENLSELRQLVPALSLLGETSPRSIDKILSYGEKISSFVLTDYLNSIGIKATFADSAKIIKTDSDHNCAVVDIEKTKSKIKDLVLPLFSVNDCVVCAGFTGSDSKNSVTTLGRGGSDYTASVASVCLDAERLEIWKEVDGIMTTDPRIIKTAKKINALSYVEASELAYFGAKVLHPKTIRPAIMAEIPVYIKKTSEPNLKGTVIRKESDTQNEVKAVAFQKNVTVINICSEKMLGAYGFLSRVFDVFTRHRTPVDLITTSEINISVTVEKNADIDNLVRELSAFSDVEISKNVAIISLVGEGLKFTSGIAARTFSAIGDINVLMVNMGASEVNLSIIVEQKDMENAVKNLHYEFFEKGAEK